MCDGHVIGCYCWCDGVPDCADGFDEMAIYCDVLTTPSTEVISTAHVPVEQACPACPLTSLSSGPNDQTQNWLAVISLGVGLTCLVLILVLIMMTVRRRKRNYQHVPEQCVKFTNSDI